MHAARRILILPIAAIALVVAAACGSDSGDVPLSAIAVVGGQTVMKAELDRILDETRANSKQSRRPFPKPGTQQYAQIREQLVQFLVRRAQFAEAADERGIEISDELVEQRRNGVIQQFFGGQGELYEKHLEKNGLTDEQTRADIKASLIQEALLRDVNNGIEVSEAEARKHYRKNKRQFAKSYKQVREAVREDLLQRKRNAASSKYVDRLVRDHDVKYQNGFAPRQ
jgi:hypothetical protein